MPRAFDRGIPPVDKNPLISATAWGDPNTIIGEAAANAAGQIQGFFFSLFEDCVEFLEGLKLLGEDGTNPIAQLGLGLQALIDQIYQLLFCGADPGITPQGLIEALSGIISGLADNVFIQGLVAFAEFIGTSVGNFAQDAIQGATDLVGLLCGILTCNPTAGLQAIDVAAHVTGLTGTTPFTIISGILDVFTPILANPFIQGVIALADEFGVAVGNFFLDIFNGVLGIFEALCSLLMTGSLPETYGNWTQTPLAILQMVIGVIEQLQANPIIAGLADLIAGSGEFIFDLIGGALEFITQLVGLLGQVMSGPQAILDFLGGIFGANGLDGWIESLPFLGPLVSKLTGLNSSGDIALDLATLGNWASGLLTNTGTIPAENLIGSIPAAILGAIPVSSINFTAGNLLGQGAFSNANTVEAAGGWVWDGTTTATGSGGSVKATATGSLQQLYSRQAIKVAAGDRVEISAKVKTSGFTSGSMVLAVVPWIGTAAQTAQVIHTRTTTASTFQAMTGSRLRIGGTAEAGEVAISGSVTALTVRLGVTANSGAVIWFDDVEVKKAGALAQTLVEYLTTTWEQTWNSVFESGGTGKQWFDFVTAVSTIFTRAKSGVEKGDAANGNALGIIDSIGKAVFGEAVFNNLPGQVKTAMQHFIAKLFGVNTVQDELTGEVLPPIDATTLTGDVPIGNLPTEQLLPTAGSGAQISRRNIVNRQASPNKNRFVNGFYDNIDFAPSADIQVLDSSNNPVSGSGAKSNLAGIYRVTTTGWYVVELCVKVNPSVSLGGHVAALLYRSTNYPSVALTPYKTGGDGVAAWWGFGGVSVRFVQSTFIVYLPAGAAVAAGYTADGYGSDVFDADADGTETYFSISLLNKIL